MGLSLSEQTGLLMKKQHDPTRQCRSRDNEVPFDSLAEQSCNVVVALGSPSLAFVLASAFTVFTLSG
jgi:hypothetical protein